MGQVIEFPGGPAFERRWIESRIEKSLDRADPEIVDCVKKGVGRILSVYSRLPTVNMTVTTPKGLNEATTRAFALEICGNYKAALDSFLKQMLVDLCVAEANLCKCRFQRK